MPYGSLAEFLEDLESAGELARVAAAVDPELEAAEVVRRAAGAEGPAVFFEQVSGTRIPVVANLLGSERRVCLALGESLDETRQRVATATQSSTSSGWLDRLKQNPLAGGAAPKDVKSGACQQVVKPAGDVDLAELPALRQWPEDSHRALTSGLLWLRCPQSGARIVAQCAALLTGRDRLAVLWAQQDAIARAWRFAAARREPLAAALVLGGDPLEQLTAAAWLPEGLDPCLLAGLLRQRPLELVRCRTVEVAIPADAEMVLEGELLPEPGAEAIRFGAADGTYRAIDGAAVLHVTAVTHRVNPICPVALMQPTGGERAAIARAVASITLPLVQQRFPELVGYELHTGGQLAVVAMEKAYPGHARTLAASLWGWRPLMFARGLVLVDADVDIADGAAVLAAVAAHADLARDALWHDGSDPFDASAPRLMAIDATRKWPGEAAAACDRVAASPEVQQQVAARWEEFGLKGLGAAR